ncbi:hypothetical protein EPN81_02400 [Patescibacteria group bacterium]|nr:MAG: hypothetical protein EPN81_02400 [Patescibacteria group bacterium]
MPNNHLCQEARVSLERIRVLKQDFDVSFEKALTSGDETDRQQAQHSKQVLDQEMTQLRIEMYAWEKRAIESQELALLESLLSKKETDDPLNKYELFVLYEIHTNKPLSDDLLEWRNTRDPKEDLLTMFDSSPHQIARSLEEITPETQIYIGKLEDGFFQHIPDTLELIYTSFPEKRIRRQNIEIGGKDELELETLLEDNGHRIGDYAKSMMAHDDFRRSLREPDPTQPDWRKWKIKSPEEITLIRLHVKDLGFPDGATTDQIYARAEELGLEFCPPEVGPQFRLQYANQPMDEYVYVGMKQIPDSDGGPSVFRVERDDGGSWLFSAWAKPADAWDADYQFVFRLRKKPLEP